MNKLARKHDVKGLIKALDYLDKSNSIDQLVGKHAATALQAIGGPAVEPLIGVIHDQTSSVRVQAVGVLGRLGDARAIEPLIGVLKETTTGACARRRRGASEASRYRWSNR